MKNRCFNLFSLHRLTRSTKGGLDPGGLQDIDTLKTQTARSNLNSALYKYVCLQLLTCRFWRSSPLRSRSWWISIWENKNRAVTVYLSNYERESSKQKGSGCVFLSNNSIPHGFMNNLTYSKYPMFSFPDSTAASTHLNTEPVLPSRSRWRLPEVIQIS